MRKDNYRIFNHCSLTLACQGRKRKERCEGKEYLDEKWHVDLFSKKDRGKIKIWGKNKMIKKFCQLI